MSNERHSDKNATPEYMRMYIFRNALVKSIGYHVNFRASYQQTLQVIIHVVKMNDGQINLLGLMTVTYYVWSVMSDYRLNPWDDPMMEIIQNIIIH